MKTDEAVRTVIREKLKNFSKKEIERLYAILKKIEEKKKKK